MEEKDLAVNGMSVTHDAEKGLSVEDKEQVDITTNEHEVVTVITDKGEALSPEPPQTVTEEKEKEDLDR